MVVATGKITLDTFTNFELLRCGGEINLIIIFFVVLYS